MKKMNKNKKLLITLLLVAFGMLGLAYAFVPMYRLFCQVLGVPSLNISVGKREAPVIHAIAGEVDRFVTIRFMGNQNIDVPVELSPVAHKMRVKIGESALTAYKAENEADQPFNGIAVHTIIGFGEGEKDVAEYVNLQQCFCFEKQLYPANEAVNLPLSFSISPELPKDVHTITFAYTLFEDVK